MQIFCLEDFRMECEEKGIVVDETFDTGIDEQKDWFYTNSGLFINKLHTKPYD